MRCRPAGAGAPLVCRAGRPVRRRAGRDPAVPPRAAATRPGGCPPALRRARRFVGGAGHLRRHPGIHSRPGRVRSAGHRRGRRPVAGPAVSRCARVRRAPPAGRSGPVRASIRTDGPGRIPLGLDRPSARAACFPSTSARSRWERCIASCGSAPAAPSRGRSCDGSTTRQVATRSTPSSWRVIRAPPRLPARPCRCHEAGRAAGPAHRGAAVRVTDGPVPRGRRPAAERRAVG